MAPTSFLGPEAYLDQLHAIERDIASDAAGADPGDPATLDRCITRVVQLAEAVLEEREQLLRWAHAQADPQAGVFRRAGAEYLAQVDERAAAYSQAYLAVDHTLAGWRAWMHARIQQ
ncbi:MAG: hypothetical protein M3Z03_04100 [Actinomycetota bacterium]|nr:hypothetical protein [Actinomycetota bacterium]